MWKIPRIYRIPIIIAIGLHIALIFALTLRLATPTFRQQASTTSQPHIVQATAINQTAVNQQIKSIQQRDARERRQAKAKLRALQAKVRAAKARRVKEQRRLARIKRQQRQLKQQQRALAAKRRRERLAKAKAAKLAAKHKAAAAKHRQQLAKQQQELQKRLMQQQLSSDQSMIKKENARLLEGVIDQYKGKILAAIAQNWLVPDNTNQKLSSLFLIHLAPGGVVLSVKLVRSSGSPPLDRSARVAILKASPLPVPKDPAVFDKFRELRLTVSPKDIVNG